MIATAGGSTTTPTTTTTPTLTTTTPPPPLTTTPPPPPLPSLINTASLPPTFSNAMGKIFRSTKCIMSHQFILLKNVLALPPHLSKLCNIYEEMYRIYQNPDETTVLSATDGIMSVLPCMCKPCLYVIFGLRDYTIARELNDIDCTLSNIAANASTKKVKMGRFLHAESSYNAQIAYNPVLALNNANNKASIMSGVAILPDPCIMVQLLGMDLKLSTDGIKVIQLLDAEVAVECHKESLDDTLKAYTNLLEKFPKELTNGYYATKKDKDGNKFYEKTNVRTEVTAKIVDVNPNIQIHYNQLLKSQEALKMPNFDQKLPNTILNIGSGNYLGNQGQFVHQLADARVYDILSYILAHTRKTEDFEDRLKQLPPFNNTCVVSTGNILVVNKDGKAYFTCEEPDPTKCTQLKRIVTNPLNPPSKRRVSVAHPSNFGTKPTNPSILTNTHSTPAPPATDSHKTKLFDIHKNEVDPYRGWLSARGPTLKNYFYKLHDDMNREIDTEEYPILEQASAFYPCKVLNASSNNHESLFLRENTGRAGDRGDLYITDDCIPNVVYMKNLGFVSLDTICDTGLLILYNCEVLIDNILRKQSGETDFLTVDAVKNKNSINLISKRGILMSLKNPVQEASTEGAIDMSTSTALANNDAQPNPNLDLCLQVPNVDSYALRHTQTNPACKAYT